MSAPVQSAVEVPMPRLSDSMEEGTILAWLVEDGAAVATGQEIAEIETDKANMPLEAPAAGPLRIVAAEGQTLEVGQPIARIGEGGDAPEGEGQSSPTAGPVAAGDPPSPAVAKASSGTAPPTAPPAGGGDSSDGSPRVKASPLARRLAGERGVELASVAGSGPGGRVVKDDVLAAVENGVGPVASAPEAPSAPPAAAPQAPSSQGAPAETAKGETEVVELTRLQETVARRMAESKATAPDFALTRDVDMDAAVALREQLKGWIGEGEKPPSYNDLVVKACALALREHPRANGAYREGRWELYGRVNVGVAVAGRDGALIVPTIFDADRAGLGEIGRASRRLAAAARDGTVTAPELSGGTFTVSNLGMFGVESFTAVINPPQAAILAVGSLAERPVVREERVLPGWRMTVTLSCDHRILSGADGAAFLARVAELLESPGALIL